MKALADADPALDALEVTEPGPIYGQDPAPAAWLTRRIDGAWGSATGVVPSGFEAYARILHPVDDDTRWATVARELGTQVHPLAQWHRLVRSTDPFNASDGSWPDRPEIGHLAPHHLQALLDVLRQHTRAPDRCWFCTWDGYGWINGTPAAVILGSADPVPPGVPQEALAAERVVLPGRSYLLGTGRLEAAAGNGWQVTPDWFQPQSQPLLAP